MTKSNHFKFNKIVLNGMGLFFASTLFTGCLTAKKVDKQVAKEYGQMAKTQTAKPNEHIAISSGIIPTGDKISTSEAKTSHMLPLIVYWQWDYKNTCTLNPQIPINNFISTVQNTVDKSLQDKVGEQRLELSVDKLPNVFAIDDKAHLVFFGYAFGWDNVSIQSDDADMVVSYKLLNANSEVKSGVITIPYVKDKMKLGMFKNWKKATSEYLKQYDSHITQMSMDVVQKLLKEI